MADTIVIGGGVGGLGSALFLARQGHRVTLVERDAPTPEPAPRQGVPQSRHSHAFLARARQELQRRAPDVLDALWAAGATPIDFTDEALLPPLLDDRSPKPGDEELVAIACRRTLFEHVLRTAALAEPTVELVTAAVTGLVVDGDRVLGVRLDDGRDLRADVTIDAAGRRSPLRDWLAEHGIELPADVVQESGILYTTRFYRYLPGQDRPPAEGQVGGDLGYLGYAVFMGDNGTFSVTFGVPTSDDELRRRLSDEAGFQAACEVLPATTAWVDPQRSEPTGGVDVMARLTNRSRRLVVDGRPVVLGLQAVGDSLVHTNPLYGRGCSLALVHAGATADAVTAHGEDLEALALTLDAAADEVLGPWFAASVSQDRGAIAAREPGAEPDPMADLLKHGVMPATRRDAVVFRAFLRMLNLLDRPDVLVADPDVIQRVMAVYAEKDTREPEPPLGPPREELLALLPA